MELGFTLNPTELAMLLKGSIPLVGLFTDAIKNNKVTRFIKDYAAKNKDVIDMGIRKGFLTKEEAINELGMKNEYQ